MRAIIILDAHVFTDWTHICMFRVKLLYRLIHILFWFVLWSWSIFKDSISHFLAKWTHPRRWNLSCIISIWCEDRASIILTLRSMIFLVLVLSSCGQLNQCFMYYTIALLFFIWRVINLWLTTLNNSASPVDTVIQLLLIYF